MNLIDADKLCPTCMCKADFGPDGCPGDCDRCNEYCVRWEDIKALIDARKEKKNDR